MLISGKCEQDTGDKYVHKQLNQISSEIIISKFLAKHYTKG